MKKIIIFIFLLFLIFFIFSKKNDDWPVLKGPYLGQKPPGMTPELFAPGIISTGYSERCPAFTPGGKEFYYVLWGAPHSIILIMKMVNEQWTKPRVVSFSGKYSEEFSMSPDGKTIVFCSDRPLKGSYIPEKHFSSWIVKKENNEWGEPKHLGPLVNLSKFGAGYPSISKYKNIYFYSYFEEKKGDDIYMSKFDNGVYSEPINLGHSINTGFDDLDPFIAADESYLIFCRKNQGFGGSDLFISFRKKDGSWTKAKNMGEGINSKAWEYCPTISSDGKYLFFTSNRRLHKSYSKIPLTYEEKIKILNSPGNGSADIYWVDAKVIEDLRPKG